MDADQRIKKLNKIYHGAHMMRRGASPAVPYMFFGAVLGGLLGFMADKVFFNQPSVWPTLIVAIVFAFVGYKQSKYKDYLTYIYDQLITYDPADQNDYEELQRQAGEGRLSSINISEWVNRERERVKPRSQSESDLARQRFATKK